MNAGFYFVIAVTGLNRPHTGEGDERYFIVTEIPLSGPGQVTDSHEVLEEAVFICSEVLT
jgi:hypothetical protein